MNTIEIYMNEELNGVELFFVNRPEASILEMLKKAEFRWHKAKKMWYAKQSRKTLQTVEYLKKVQDRAETITDDKKSRNHYDIKVGDIFVVSWGYEQTNLNFYQVISLVGKTSVRIVEINPVIIEEIQQNMGRNIKIKNDATMMERKSFHQFIKNNESGDLKRVFNKGEPYIKISDYYAYLYKGQILTESWYA